MLNSAALILGVVAVCLTIATGTGALIVALRKRARTMAAMADALLGHEEISDRSGAVFQEAQPGLAARVASMDGKLDKIIELELDRRVSALEDGQLNLTGRVSVLEDTRVEQVVSRVESTEAYRAIQAAQAAPSPGEQPDLT